jgi:hypothetical protein
LYVFFTKPRFLTTFRDFYRFHMISDHQIYRHLRAECDTGNPSNFTVISITQFHDTAIIQIFSFLPEMGF